MNDMGLHSGDLMAVDKKEKPQKEILSFQKQMTSLPLNASSLSPELPCNQ